MNTAMQEARWFWSVVLLLIGAGCGGTQPGSRPSPEADSARRAIAAANAEPADLERQREAVRSNNQVMISAGEQHAWFEPIRPVLQRLDRSGATCDDQLLVASTYTRLIAFTGFDAELQRAATIWQACPTVATAKEPWVAGIHERLGQCAHYVELVKTVWPEAAHVDRQALLAQIETCSTPSNRFIHLSQLLSLRELMAYEEWRLDQSRIDLERAIRDFQIASANECTSYCSRVYDSCLPTCSGTGCTVCGQAQAQCQAQCPTTP